MCTQIFRTTFKHENKKKYDYRHKGQHKCIIYTLGNAYKTLIK